MHRNSRNLQLSSTFWRLSERTRYSLKKQKPGETKGPITNLNPITLLSMLRKILASCMKQRLIDRIDREIPPPQAAYRTGLRITEHVFAMKIHLEKVIATQG